MSVYPFLLERSLFTRNVPELEGQGSISNPILSIPCKSFSGYFQNHQAIGGK